MLQLLAGRLGQAFVANDKVHLTIDDDGVHARALPTSLALRPDTIAMFSAVGDSAAQAAFSLVDNHPRRTGADRRLLLPPRRLAEAFDVALCDGGPVTAIVVTMAASRPRAGRGGADHRLPQ